MYPILKKEMLADRIFLMEVEAPLVAESCLPGQFVIVRTDEESERIPLTICDYDAKKGTITLVVQMIGASTEKMQRLNAGDAFHDFVGPLGNPSDLCKEENLEEVKKKKMRTKLVPILRFGFHKYKVSVHYFVTLIFEKKFVHSLFL